MHYIGSNSLENPDTITQKGLLKGIVPVAHSGLGIVSASSFQLENLVISEIRGRVFKRVLPQKWEIISP